MFGFKDRAFIHSEQSLYSKETEPLSRENEAFVFLWIEVITSFLIYPRPPKGARQAL